MVLTRNLWPPHNLSCVSTFVVYRVVRWCIFYLGEADCQYSIAFHIKPVLVLHLIFLTCPSPCFLFSIPLPILPSPLRFFSFISLPSSLSPSLTHSLHLVFLPLPFSFLIFLFPFPSYLSLLQYFLYFSSSFPFLTYYPSFLSSSCQFSRFILLFPLSRFSTYRSSLPRPLAPFLKYLPSTFCSSPFTLLPSSLFYWSSLSYFSFFSFDLSVTPSLSYPSFSFSPFLFLYSCVLRVQKRKEKESHGLKVKTPVI